MISWSPVAADAPAPAAVGRFQAISEHGVVVVVALASGI